MFYHGVTQKCCVNYAEISFIILGPGFNQCCHIPLKLSFSRPGCYLKLLYAVNSIMVDTLISKTFKDKVLKLKILKCC